MARADTRTRWMTAVGLLGAGAVAGIIGASAFGASATTSGTATTSTSSSSGSSPSSSAPAVPGDDNGNRGDHGGRGPTGDHGAPGETVVTGSKAATLKAAALQHVPGGTVDRIETDSGDAAYEVHLTNSSGKQVTVKFDKNLKFVSVEDGMGK